MDLSSRRSSTVSALRQKFEQDVLNGNEEKSPPTPVRPFSFKKQAPDISTRISALRLSSLPPDEESKTNKDNNNLDPLITASLPSVLPGKIKKSRPFSFSEATENRPRDRRSHLETSQQRSGSLSPQNESDAPEKPPRTFLYDLLSDPPLETKNVATNRNGAYINVNHDTGTPKYHFVTTNPLLESREKPKRFGRVIELEPDYDYGYIINKVPSVENNRSSRSSLSPHKIATASIRPIRVGLSSLSNSSEENLLSCENNSVQSGGPQAPPRLRATSEWALHKYGLRDGNNGSKEEKRRGIINEAGGELFNNRIFKRESESQEFINYNNSKEEPHHQMNQSQNQRLSYLHNQSSQPPGGQQRSHQSQSIHSLVNNLYPVVRGGGGGGGGGINHKKSTQSTDSGIHCQLGTESLSSCDTPIGDSSTSTTDTGDSDCEDEIENSQNARQIVEERKGYIRRVSSIRTTDLLPIHRLLRNHALPQSQFQSHLDPNSSQFTISHPLSHPRSSLSNINNNNNNSKLVYHSHPHLHHHPSSAPDSLFDILLIIGIRRDESTGAYDPIIKYAFPKHVELPMGIERFCFPDALEWPSHEGKSAQFYTLTLTQSDGSRKYGCCYRILPDGANICIPIVYCIISSRRAIGFYREVLVNLGSRHGYNDSQMEFIISSLYKESVPRGGKSLVVHDPISVVSINDDVYGRPVPIILRRKADGRLEESDLFTLLTSVHDLSTVLRLFGSLLLERKVILISRSLHMLSFCIEALESLLYPFTWQHTFIPILPLNMTEYLELPAPFVIGVLRSKVVPFEFKLDDGIIYDLDSRKILSCVGDEGTILPKRLYKKLRDALQAVQNLSDQTENTKNVLISECFIRMFVEALGNYKANGLFDLYPTPVQNHGEVTDVREFRKEIFLKSISSKSVRNFMEWFTETSMFQNFIEIRKKSDFKPGLFEQRCIEQLESIYSNPSNSSSVSSTHHHHHHHHGVGWKSTNNLFTKSSAWIKETFSK